MHIVSTVCAYSIVAHTYIKLHVHVYTYICIGTTCMYIHMYMEYMYIYIHIYRESAEQRVKELDILVKETFKKFALSYEDEADEEDQLSDEAPEQTKL